MSKEELFCDGGCLGSNPSLKGGTFAWILVYRDRIVRSDFGMLTPEDAGVEKITNNLTELLAVLRGLEAMEPNWKGILYTDSLITLRRITSGKKFKNIPDYLVDRVLKIREGRKWKAILLKGHPSREDLRAGRTKKGRPVSKYNKMCDDICKDLSKKFFSDLNSK